jgi:hypothetical protein
MMMIKDPPDGQARPGFEEPALDPKWPKHIAPPEMKMYYRGLEAPPNLTPSPAI